MADKSTTRKINIWINGRQVENTYKGIWTSMRKARNELANMTVGSKEYLAQTKKLKQLQGLMDQHRKQQGQVANGWTKIKNEFKSTSLAFVAGNMITSAVQNIGSAFTGLISGAASLSDQLADIQKTTGLTAKEVDELNGSLSKIDTRTPTSELRNLAAIAGKLGKNSKEEVLEFVGAADKLVVALGEDLGGLDAIKQLGKLNELFNIEEVYGTATAFEKTGSAINSLGAASVASEEYLVAFTQRFGGLAENANISMQDVLGLAATMDILGKKQEVASSSMAKFLIALGDKKGVSKFAKLAGLSVKEYSKLLETDANEAMLKVLEGAKSTKQGVAGLSATLENLGVEGVQAAQVLPALAGNIDLLREQQELANVEFEKGSSLTDEYNIKNENLAAKLDKLKKAWVKLWMNSNVKNAIEGLVDSLVSAVAWIEENSQTIKFLAKVIALVVIAITSYNLALKANAAWTNLIILKNNLLRKSQLLAALTQAKLTGNTKRAAAAQRMLNIAMKANPWGLVAAAIVSAGVAIVIFKDTLLGLNSLQKAQNEIVKETNKRMGDEAVKLEVLKKRIGDTNITNEDRKKLIKEINVSYGDYLPNLLDENASLTDIAAAYDLINNAIRKKIELQVKEEKAVGIYKEIVELQEKLKEQTEDLPQSYGDVILDNLTGGNMTQRMAGIAKLQGKIKDLQSTYDVLTGSLAEEESKKTNKKTTTTTNSGRGGSGGGGEEETDPLEKYAKKYEQLRKIILGIRRKFNLADLSEEEKAIENIIDKYDDQFQAVENSIAHFEEIRAKKGKLNDDELDLLNKFFAQRDQLVDARNNEFLKSEQDFAKKLEDEKIKFQGKVDEILMDGTQKEIHQVTKKYKELIDKAKDYKISTVELVKKMNAEIEAIKNGDEAPTDIFGMTPEDWELLNENVNKAMTIAGELSNIFSLNNQKLNNQENAKLASYEKNSDKKKKTLQKRLDAGLISEKYYNSQIKVIDADLDREKGRVAAKQAKREKQLKKYDATMNMFSALANIWGKWAANPIYAGLLSAFALIKTKKQIDAINSEPIPSYGKGARVNKRTIAEIGEAGPEIVLSSSIVQSKTLGPIADDLARVQEGKQPQFLGRPQSPNFSGMEKAIAGKQGGNTVVSNNNTVINQVDTEGAKQMNDKIELMATNIAEMTKSVADLKYLRAVITDDDLTEHDEEKIIRMKYSGF